LAQILVAPCLIGCDAFRQRVQHFQRAAQHSHAHLVEQRAKWLFMVKYPPRGIMMRRRNQLLVLFAFALLLPLGLHSDKKQKDSAKLGNLLVSLVTVKTPESIPARVGDPRREVNPRHGYYFVRAQLTFRNIGKRAICANVIPRLIAEYGLEYGDWEGSGLRAKITELIPGEDMAAEYTFQIKQGAKALELMLEAKDYSEGCTPKNPASLRPPSIREIFVQGRQVRFRLKDLSP